MIFRNDCKIEMSIYEFSPQTWRAEVNILRVNSGEILLARTTVCGPANTYRNVASALETVRAYAEAMIASGEFDCSLALN